MRPADLLLLAAALAGTAALAHAPAWLAPPLVALADLRLHADEAVAVEALVARSHLAGAGAQVLRLADGTGQAAAFWPSTEPVEGAWVRAEGTVARVRGQWELLTRDVEVLAPREAPLTVAQAARLAPALVGRDVAVAGRAEWSEEGGPRLRGDDGARLPVLLRDEAAFAEGAQVLATGRLRYDTARASYRLEASEVRPA